VNGWKKHNGKNQRWIIKYGENTGSDMQRKGKDNYFGFVINEPFYAFCKDSAQSVIDVIGGKNLSLKKFVRNQQSQQFVLDASSKTVKSVAYNDKSWDIENQGKSNNMQIWKTSTRWFQMFKLAGDRIRNERGQYVAVQNKENVVVQKSSNGFCSRWNVKYVKDEQNYKDGEFHPKYGFICNKQFYIISKRDQRHLESFRHIGGKVVTKIRNGKNVQKWTFNCDMEALVMSGNQVLMQ